MQTPHHPELTATIKSTLDMTALGLSLVAQRHFTNNHNWDHIRDNTGNTIFVNVPSIPNSLTLPSSKAQLSYSQYNAFSRLFESYFTSSNTPANSSSYFHRIPLW